MDRSASKPTEEERAARRREDRDRLEQAARELLTSEGWQNWVRVRAANGLRKYSTGNLMLIAMACPQATFVAGFRAWLKLDRCVRKGENAIRILAPMPVRRRDGEDAAASDEDGEVRVLFRSVAVFDVSATDVLPGRFPPPLGPPCEPITGDSHADLLPKLGRLASELGYEVEQRSLTASAGGWCDPDAKQIVVNAGLPANGRVRVLVHELAHALGIGYANLGRQRAEVLVDCVTFIVLGAVGLDTGGESIPYVAGWGEGGELDAIRAYAETIDEVARRIESAVLDAEDTDMAVAA